MIVAEPTPAQQLSSMDSSVAVINGIIDEETHRYPPEEIFRIVDKNVEHLELMIGDRVAELGDSPDLSSYKATITAGKTYLEDV